MIDKIKYFPAFILPLGCMGLWSGFQVIAFLVWYWYWYKCRNLYEYRMFFCNKIIKNSIFMIFLWILSIAFASLIVNSNSGLSQSCKYIERIVPFFLVGIFAMKDKKFTMSLWLGLCFSALILDLNTIYSFFIDGVWRPTTFLGSPNKLGGFLILLLPFIIAGIYTWKNVRILRYFGCFIFLLTSIALVISGSRGAWLGFIFSCIISGIVLVNKYKSFNLKKFYFISGTFFVIIVFCIYYFFPHIIFRNYDGERLLLWKSAIKMFFDYPISGVGFGNFNKFYVLNYISPLAHEPNLGSPHNIFLHYFVEFGIIGGGSFILLVIFQLKVLYNNILQKKYNLNIWGLAGFAGVLGMCIHGLFDTQITVRPYAMMYWLLYGVSCSQIVSKGECND